MNPGKGGPSGLRSVIHGTLLVIMVLTILAAPAQALVQTLPGEPDPGFGTAGVSRMDLRPNTHDVGRAIAFRDHSTAKQPVYFGSAGDDFGLMSQNANGSGEIGQDGEIVTDFAGRDDDAYAGLYQVDDKLVAAGSSDSDVALARYSTWSGQPDNTFGSNGQVLLDFGGNDVAYTIVASTSGLVFGGNLGGQFQIAGVRPDGTLDTGFGVGGLAKAGVSGTVRKLVVLADGVLLAAGDNGSDLIVARFSATGVLDPTFGVAGLAVIDSGRNDQLAGMGIDPAGNPVLGATSGDDYLAARLNGSGKLDLSFGIAGFAVAAIAGVQRAVGVVSLPEGRTIVGGNSEGKVLFATFDAQGSLVTTFGSGLPPSDGFGGFDGLHSLQAMTSGPIDGTWTAVGSHVYEGNSNFAWKTTASTTGGVNAVAIGGFGSPDETVLSVKILTDGSIMALVNLGTDAAVIKLTPDGNPDSSFAAGGIFITQQLTPAGELVIQGDGKIVFAGGKNRQAIMARLTPDGRMDHTFGPRGFMTVDPVSEDEHYNFSDLAEQPGGRLIAAGPQPGNIQGFLADGQTDPTFGTDGSVALAQREFEIQLIDPGGYIFLIANPLNKSQIIRLTPSGWPDPTFGANGVLLSAEARTLAVQKDRKLLAGWGSSSDPTTFVVERYLPDGKKDLDFGTNGRVEFVWPHTGRAGVIHEQEDGSIVLASQYVVGRLRSNGDTDVAFGNQGFLKTPEFDDGAQFYSRRYSRPATVAGGHLYLAGKDWGSFTISKRFLDDSPPALASSWGWSGYGQTGSGSTSGLQARYRVPQFSGAGDVAAGLIHSLFVAPGGTVRATGSNVLGQLGDGTTTDRSTPVAVRNLTGVTQVDGGWYHSVALKSDGTVWAWGWNGYGTLGVSPGSTSVRNTPARVPGLTNIVQISAGAFHTLALRSDGTVWAWGWNELGQLGVGTKSFNSLAVRVAGLTGVTKISAGDMHNLVIKSDGSAWGWGWNALGQVGDGTRIDRLRPFRIGTGFSEISGGLYHSAGITQAGKVLTWGWNGHHQLATGFGEGHIAPAEMWTQPFEPHKISAGGFHTLVLAKDGTVWAWGNAAYGQMGNPNFPSPNSSMAMAVPGLIDQRDVSAGYLHSLSN